MWVRYCWKMPKPASSSTWIPHDKTFRRRYMQAATQRQAALNQAFHQAGVDVLAISTADDLVRALAGFATLRQRRRK